MFENVEKICTRVDALHSDRGNWASYWQDIASFCFPRKAYINQTRVSGQRLEFHRIFDTTAVRALRTMSSGFHSNLTNPSSKWFTLEIDGDSPEETKALKDDKNVDIWLNQVEEKIFKTLNESNFDEIIQEFYVDAGSFGTGTIFIEQDNKTIVNFYSIPIKEVLIEEDSRGRVTRVYRLFQYTAQQAYDRWGEAVSDDIKNAVIKQEISKKFWFIHATFPRDERVVGKLDNINKPYASMWIEKEKKNLLHEGGFDEMPYMVGRFYKENDEPWGYSPAMEGFSEIKLLNTMSKTILRAAQKIVDPPFLFKSQTVILPFNLNPAKGNTMSGQEDDIRKIFMPIKTEGNLPIGLEMENQRRDIVKEAFFVPLFQVLSNLHQQMTVPEVQQRIREGMTLLGPVVGRFEGEMLSPTITRVFNILGRSGQLPNVPEQLRGKSFTIKYISPLAKAQRGAEAQSIITTLDVVGQMAQAVPSVLDKIDTDKAVDIIADVNGVNPEIIRSAGQVEKIRTARAEAQQAVQEAEQISQGAGVAKDLSQAQKNIQG